MSSGSSETALVSWPLSRPSATLSRARGRGLRPGFVWSVGPSAGLRPPSPGGGVRGVASGSFGQLAPQPAFGHPLPGARGRGLRPGFVWSVGPSAGLRPPSPGGEGSRCGLGFLWSVAPQPAFGHPLPGGEGSRIAARVCLVSWPLSRPSATLSRGARVRGLRPGFVWSVGPSPGLRPPSPGGRGVEARVRVPLKIAANRSAGLSFFLIFMSEGAAKVVAGRCEGEDRVAKELGWRTRVHPNSIGEKVGG